MLKYNSVTIFLNVTAKVCDNWPLASELRNRTFINFNILPFNSFRTELMPIPRNTSGSSYPILLLVNNSLAPDIQISPNYSAHSTVTVELFESGFVVFQLKAEISTDISVRDTNAIINGIIKTRSISLGNMLYNYIEFAEYILNLIQGEIFKGDLNAIMLSEAYSIIQPGGFTPRIKSTEIVGSEYETELYEAAIRRVPDMSEQVIEVARNEQKNLSVYNDDLVFLNYHNFLVFVVPARNHLPADLYIELVNQFKLFIANLSYMQNEVTANLAQLRSIPTALSTLSSESEWLDLYRFKFLKAKEEFESAIDIAAVRVSWFNKSAHDKFGIFEKQARLERDLDEIEKIITRKLSLLREKHLQRISTILTILSLILAIIDIIAGIILAG